MESRKALLVNQLQDWIRDKKEIQIRDYGCSNYRILDAYANPLMNIPCAVVDSLVNNGFIQILRRPDKSRWIQQTKPFN